MEFLLYSTVGGVATSAHYVTLFVLVEAAGLDPSIAAGLGAFIGAVVAYCGNRLYTFSDSRVRHLISLSRFFGVAGAGMLLSAGIVALGVTIMSVHYFAAQVVATLVVLVFTYLINRTWTFG